MGGLLSTVQMAVSMQPSPEQHDNETAEQRDEAVSILFALDLSALGTVNIDARITTRSLHAAIYSQQEGARSFMQQHLERLSQRLDALGFKEVHLTTLQLAEVGEEKRERFEKLAHGLPLSTGLLDVTG